MGLSACWMYHGANPLPTASSHHAVTFCRTASQGMQTCAAEPWIPYLQPTSQPVNRPTRQRHHCCMAVCLVRRYLTINATKGQKFFYVFGEAETDPKTAPLIFWMNG